MGEFARGPKQPAERNKLSSGNVQRCFSLLLLVLPPTSLPRFQPPNFKIYREAGEHFGWLAHFFSTDNPSSSTLTQQRLGWHPVEPALLADLDQDHYFNNEM
jgi:hypothetical protein